LSLLKENFVPDSQLIELKRFRPFACP